MYIHIPCATVIPKKCIRNKKSFFTCHMKKLFFVMSRHKSSAMVIAVIGFSVPQTSDCGIKIFYSKYKYETSSSIFEPAKPDCLMKIFHHTMVNYCNGI